MHRGVGHGVLAGLRLSKMDVRWYNHCDAEDCARVFANLEAEDGVTSARLARPGRRRWLITEGCFAGTGRVAPVPALLDLKDTHHARLILDESSSFGAMGGTGRGVTEHFGVDAGRVDVIAASLENAGASVGGFCAGDTGVVAYQRLMGSGYVFSASLPPYLLFLYFICQDVNGLSAEAKAGFTSLLGFVFMTVATSIVSTKTFGLNLANVVCLGAYTAMVSAGLPLPNNDGTHRPDPRASEGLRPTDVARRNDS